jgi:hypothetical protein
VNLDGTLYGYYGDTNGNGIINENDTVFCSNRAESNYGVCDNFVVQKVQEDTLLNIAMLVPNYSTLYDGCELAGMIFFQGWNDMIDGGQ